MATVTFRGAQRWSSGAAAPAVAGLDLEITDGEFMVLVGPSGCGKSTTLRMLAGLEPVDDGGIFIADRGVTTVPPKDRDIAMVFQNYALYPHMTVAENMGFALRMAKMKSAERQERVLDAAKLGLTEYLDRRPRALSVGQRQRVAMGRAIVRHPAVFCMDEPLSNLDAKMRVQTRADIARLQSELGTTTVYVTHGQVEAMTMGHRVAVMNDGELQQVDSPLTLYDKPANVFVAGFIGSPRMNLIPAAVVDGQAVVRDLRIPVHATGAGATGASVTVGVRPEGFRLVRPGRGGIAMEVMLVEELGADSFVHGFADITGERQLLIVRSEDRGAVRKGDVRARPPRGVACACLRLRVGRTSGCIRATRCFSLYSHGASYGACSSAAAQSNWIAPAPCRTTSQPRVTAAAPKPGGMPTPVAIEAGGQCLSGRMGAARHTPILGGKKRPSAVKALNPHSRSIGGSAIRSSVRAQAVNATPRPMPVMVS